MANIVEEETFESSKWVRTEVVCCSEDGCQERSTYRGKAVDKWRNREWYCKKHGGEMRNRLSAYQAKGQFPPTLDRDWFIFFAYYSGTTNKELRAIMCLSYTTLLNIIHKRQRVYRKYVKHNDLQAIRLSKQAAQEFANKNVLLLDVASSVLDRELYQLVRDVL